MSSGNPQEKHFESIHQKYDLHYYDPESMAYRERYIYDPLFHGLDLNDKVVGDLACGSGYNSLALKQRFPSIKTIGFDISPSACEMYRRLTGGEAVHVDLTEPFEKDIEPLDAALIIGGLHHCVNSMETVIENMARLVKPGGQIMMMEPNREFFLSWVRTLWYRLDFWFEPENEAAVSHDDLYQLASSFFEVEKTVYFGGPAFFFVLNSLIMRVPRRLKSQVARVLHPVEDVYNLLPGRAAHAAFSAVWRRKM